MTIEFREPFPTMTDIRVMSNLGAMMSSWNLMIYIFSGKDMMMETHIHAKEQGDMAASTETIVTDLERLARCGFTSEESVSLLWLQQWYQTEGSDRVALVHHWEFLKLLVLTGKLDV